MKQWAPAIGSGGLIYFDGRIIDGWVPKGRTVLGTWSVSSSEGAVSIGGHRALLLRIHAMSTFDGRSRYAS
jgi:hypothetical protein